MLNKPDWILIGQALVVYLLCIGFSLPVLFMLSGTVHWGFAVPLALTNFVVILMVLSE